MAEELALHQLEVGDEAVGERARVGEALVVGRELVDVAEHLRGVRTEVAVATGQ